MESAMKAMLAQMGFGYLDRYQVDIVTTIMDKNVTTVGVAVPRQNGKSEAVIVAGFLLAIAGFKTYYSISSGSSLQAIQQRFEDIAVNNEVVSRFVRDLDLKPKRGLPNISFFNGGRLFLGVRSTRYPVGTTFDCLIVDEAQLYTNSQDEALVATMTVSKLGKKVLLGTPPTEEDWRSVGTGPFLKLRALLYGVRRKTSRWIEYSPGRDYDPERPVTLALCKRCNPAWRRIPNFERKVAREQAEQDRLTFFRQRLGQFVDYSRGTSGDEDPALSADELASIVTKHEVESGTVNIILCLSPGADRYYALVSNGRLHMVVRQWPASDGISAIFAWLSEPKRYRIHSIVLERSDASRALKALLDNNKRLSRLSSVASAAMLTGRIEVFRDRVSRADDGLFFAHCGDTTDIAYKALGSFWFTSDARGNTDVGAVNADLASVARGFMLAVSGDDLTQRATSVVGV